MERGIVAAPVFCDLPSYNLADIHATGSGQDRASGRRHCRRMRRSTFSYDNDGNLIQKTTDGTTTTYVWDYANRLTALGVGGATTTYGYDAFGQRVLQTTATTTTLDSRFCSNACRQRAYRERAAV
jgi:uncharacterized protein RhaS with RHS repeats